MSDETAKVPLEGRVAGILNAHELVINIGARAGVRQGRKFAVLAQTPIEVRDPVTSKVLDSIDREKVRVEAREVRPRITICRTYKMRKGAASIGLTAQLLRGISEPVPETLRADDASMPPPLSEEESYVKINDRVVSVDDA